MSILYAVVGVVAAQRIGELALAAANRRRLLAEGGVEIDRAGYPWLAGLHAAWLASLAVFVPADAAASWLLLAVYAALQLGRLWVLASLGRRWTTRIIVLPGAPLVTAGPYRFLRHPNYAIVAAEIAALPLAFGATGLAAAFSAGNLVLLARRIAIENRALAPLREDALSASPVRRRREAEHPAVPDAAAAVAAAARPARSAAAAAVAVAVRSPPPSR